VIFEGIGSRLEFGCFFRDSLGDPRLRAYALGWLDLGPWGYQEASYNTLAENYKL